MTGGDRFAQGDPTEILGTPLETPLPRYPNDANRRSELRAFLMRRRSNLCPSEVGLPTTRRRRVRGLRREEVAELAGVSVEWYRRFESGRAIGVSPRFVARLGTALLLTPGQRRSLFRLALPELYDAEMEVHTPPTADDLQTEAV
jgi:hypothetical protein